MKTLVDDTKLTLLLEKKRNYIGNDVAIDSVISAVSFLASSIFADYKDYLGISGIFYKAICIILGIYFTGKIMYKVRQAKHNHYSHEDLFKDIKKLNEIAHQHSIVIIKDTFKPYSNRFLVYDDVRWGCKLFLNFKTNENNEDFIKSHLSSELKIPKGTIALRYVTSDLREKYSVSAKKNKVYDHKFYLARVEKFNQRMENDEFEIDSKRYYWKTLDQLEQDKNVIEKNQDILNVVKESF